MFSLHHRRLSHILGPIGILWLSMMVLFGSVPFVRADLVLFSKRVSSFIMSPDGKRVVYISVPEDGSPLLVSAVLPNGPSQNLVDEQTFAGTIGDFIISPDSSTVVFTAYHSDGEGGLPSSALHSIPISGGTPVTWQLNGAQSVGMRFKISSDNRYIVFSGGGTTQTCALYTAPLQGGSITKLAPISCWEDFDLTPDGSRIIYEEGYNTLKTIPVDGGEPVEITTNFTDRDRYIISADGSYIVYLSGGEPPQYGGKPPRLYSAALASGTSTMLDSTFPLRCIARYVSVYNYYACPFAIDPSSQRVIFPVETNDEYALYSVPIAGGAADVLATAPCSFAEVTLSLDGTRITYNACPVGDNTIRRLHSMSLAGGTHVDLNVGLAYDRYYNDVLVISPDNQYILYSADGSDADWYAGYLDVYSIPIEGGIPTLISSHVSMFALYETPWIFSKNHSQVIFSNTVSWTPSRLDQLYRSTLSDGSSSIFASHSSIGDYTLTPDERYIIYEADFVDPGWDLYVISLADAQLFLPFVLAPDAQ